MITAKKCRQLAKEGHLFNKERALKDCLDHIELMAYRGALSCIVKVPIFCYRFIEGQLESNEFHYIELGPDIKEDIYALLVYW